MMSLARRAFRPAEESPRSVVVAVGDAAHAAARALAEKRGGEILSAQGFSEVAVQLEEVRRGTATVVADLEGVSLAALLATAQMSARSFPDLGLGFLYGRGGTELLEAVDRLPKAPRVGPAGAPQSLFVGADTPVLLRGARLLHRNPEGASEERVEERLLEPSELAFFFGHANAMHLSLRGAVLCRRSTCAAPSPEQLGVYPCFRGDPCHFGEQRDAREVSIDRLSIRRIVLISCYGVSFGDVPFAAAYSIGEGLLRHSGAEVLLTAARASAVSEADLAMAYYLINAGLPFGLVASRLNRFRLDRGEVAEFLCFGDPESRMESALAPAPCRPEGGLLVLDPGDDTGAERDLVADLPTRNLGRDPVLVDESAGHLLGAVVDPGGSLYVTVPADWKARPVKLRIVSRSSLSDPGGWVRALRRDLAFLEIYLPLVSCTNEDSKALSNAATALSSLVDFLQRWPLAEFPVCLSLEYREIRSLQRKLRRLVDDLGRKAQLLYLDLMVRDQRTHPTPWDSAFETVLKEPDTTRCAYCGHEIDEFEMRSRLGEVTRRWGLCRSACAYVWDGNAALGRWLETPGQLRAGGEALVILEARNCYGMELSAVSSLVLKHFQDGRNHVIGPVETTVEPGRTARLEHHLRVPDSFTAGIYHLGGSLSLGTSVNFFRAQVRIGESPRES